MASSSAARVTPAPAPAAVLVHPSAEAAHLRFLLDKQPSCLMRVGIDGVLLAVNDAALALLGAAQLAQVLDRNIQERLSPGQESWWPEFVARVTASGSGSGECTISDLAGTTRCVVVQAGALLEHPDGVPSLLITVRDVSTARRLEASLQAEQAERQKLQDSFTRQHQAALALRDQEAQKAIAAARAEVDHRAAEQQRELRAALDAAEADRAELQALVRQQQAAVAQRDQELQALVAAARAEAERQMAEQQRHLRAALEAAESERRQLQAALKEHVAGQEAFEAALRERELKRQRSLAEHATARLSAERALAETRAELEQLRNVVSTIMDAAARAKSPLRKTDGE